MSTHTKPKNQKAKSANVFRAGVSLPDETYRRGLALAKMDGRPFSNFIYALIEREWERTGEKKGKS